MANQIFHNAFAGRKVFVTGHTGFKGSWLTHWLVSLGADVTGYGLVPPTSPAHFDLLGLSEKIHHVVGDVRDLAMLKETMRAARPEIVFHLAAQPLVRLSYAEPRETFETNVVGTINVFEAVKSTDSVSSIVNITSDKCYNNREIDHAYTEDEAMGGFDPYSASKGAAELVTSAYRNSFFTPESGIQLASVRAGNVIGGGDWAADRIIPDSVRALSTNSPIEVRNPNAIRPWQHVLEPLAGYLWLGARMLTEEKRLDSAYNFGPTPEGHLTVENVVNAIVSTWGSGSWTTPATSVPQPHEAHFLKLNSSRAEQILGWKPVWNSSETLTRTAAWYRDFYLQEKSAVELTNADINAYVTAARAADVAWSRHEATQ
uniref:CDP-glucose 4,6-dehydratase n=1 Tax=uncultured Actinomycetes bacterium TaxID=152507 RepID=A0A871YED3_9ACTN|nr:CDP-glucose 4,6-dehydratase [uncultured Actinomycetes bacterium]